MTQRKAAHTSKLQSAKGFTLVELLTVVAIVAILVVISIPAYNASLDGVKQDVDKANERDALALGHAAIMVESIGTGAADKIFTGGATEATAYFVIQPGGKGELVKTLPAGYVGYGECANHKGGYIKLNLNKDGNITYDWEGGTAQAGKQHVG